MNTGDDPRNVLPLGEDVGAMAFVQSSHLCSGIDEAAMKLLMEGGEVVEYGPAEIVLGEGSTDDFMFMVLDGNVSIRKLKGSDVVELAAFEKSAIIGEIAVLTERKRTASVVTQTDTKLVRWPGPVVRIVCEKAPKFGRRLAALMAGRTRDTDSKLDPNDG